MRGHLSILILASLLMRSPVFANESMGTPAAREEVKKAEAARDAGDFKAAREAYHRASQIDPDFVKAHENYILMTQLVAEQMANRASPDASAEGHEDEADEHLLAEYKELARQQPYRAVYLWALGYLNLEHKPQAAELYLREALRLDPNFAAAFSSLSTLDSARGNLQAELEDFQKASQASPSNPEYLYNYAAALKEINPQESERLSKELLRRFPDADSVSPTLYMLAEQATTSQGKIQYLEMLKAKFPPSKSYLSEGGMRVLFDIYDKSDQGKALALAKEMETARGEDWGLFARYEEQMISAEHLLASGNAKAATQLLAKVGLPTYADNTRLILLRARAADANGETQSAYEDLLKTFASDPTDELQAAIMTYAQKLGKTRKQTDAAVLKIRDANAKPAVPFTLPTYGEPKQVSLSDFKGRVVLLNFWYPGCGPCRGEFRYLRAVFEKYRNQGLTVIAVNTMPVVCPPNPQGRSYEIRIQ